MQSNLLNSGLLPAPRRDSLCESADVPLDDGLINEVSDEAIRARPRPCVSLGARILAPGPVDAHRHLVAGRLALLRFDEMPPTPPAANGFAARRAIMGAARIVKHAL